MRGGEDMLDILGFGGGILEPREVIRQLSQPIAPKLNDAGNDGTDFGFCRAFDGFLKVRPHGGGSRSALYWRPISTAKIALRRFEVSRKRNVWSVSFRGASVFSCRKSSCWAHHDGIGGRGDEVGGRREVSERNLGKYLITGDASATNIFADYSGRLLMSLREDCVGGRGRRGCSVF